MQRNPQPPRSQHPAARPQQPYTSSGQRPARPAQTASAGVRPAAKRPVAPGAKPANHYSQAAGHPQNVRTTVPRSGGQAPVRPLNPQQRRPASPSAPARKTQTVQEPFVGSRDTKPMIVSTIAIVLIIALGCLMQYVIYPGGYFPEKTANAVETVAEIASSRGVRINEVMTSNKTALSDDSGAYPDWIELINTSGSTEDITGWSLLDKASRTTYFTFPEYQLDPGETVLVFASGHLSDVNGSDFNAPFRLGSAGDTLMLSDNHNTVVESINIPALGANQSYARQDGGWIITSEYTPGLENTTLNFAMLTSTQPTAGSPLLITEVMADNASYPAADNVLYDWIEIQNISSEAIDLKGYALSDSPDKAARWKFPSLVIQPGQCLVVYASGLDQQGDANNLHANFGLRAEGESVLLYNADGKVLDYVEYDNLKTDQSLRRQSDGSYTTSGAATPGQAN